MNTVVSREFKKLKARGVLNEGAKETVYDYLYSQYGLNDSSPLADELFNAVNEAYDIVSSS